MTLTTVTVTSTATLLASGVGTVYLQTGAKIAIGDSTVTYATGILINLSLDTPDYIMKIELGSTDELYGAMNGAGSTQVKVLHTR